MVNCVVNGVVIGSCTSMQVNHPVIEYGGFESFVEQLPDSDRMFWNYESGRFSQYDNDELQYEYRPGISLTRKN